MRASDEFWFRFALRYDDPIFSLHRSRSLFVRSLPQAAVILDLGGTHLSADEGAFVRLGYPYAFERLVIVDLPSEDRHELYRAGEPPIAWTRPAGRSSTRSTRWPICRRTRTGRSTSSTRARDRARARARRRRRDRRDVPGPEPGGWFCLDTPNGGCAGSSSRGATSPSRTPITTSSTTTRAAGEAGRGRLRDRPRPRASCSCRRAWPTGRFSFEELAGNTGVFHEIDDCYLLAYVCRKPATERQALRRVMAATIGSARFTCQRPTLRRVARRCRRSRAHAVAPADLLAFLVGAAVVADRDLVDAASRPAATLAVISGSKPKRSSSSVDALERPRGGTPCSRSPCR